MATFCNSHVKTLEQCHVSPPQDSLLPSLSLPLTFFDIPWLLFPPSQPLFFYHIPISPLTSISLLKLSLSLALRHFHPLAGKLQIPILPSKPHLIYRKPDSVFLTIAQSSADFALLTGNGPKDSAFFGPLVPKSIDLLSIQITIFPDSGICIGFSLNQVVADQRTFFLFVKLWASICNHIAQGKSISALKNEPKIELFFDRTIIEDPKGIEGTLLHEFNILNYFTPKPESGLIANPKDLVRATFVLSLAHLEKIKAEIIDLCEKNKESLPVRLSPYVLASAFIWVSLIRAKKGFKEKEVQKQGMLCFGFIAGGIHRLRNHKIPNNYFGNCVAFGKSTTTKDDILGENGIVFAAKAVARTIDELDRDILGGVENWVKELEGLFGNKDSVVVVGSPKVGLYEIDFGWGKPNKVDDVCINSMYVSMGVNAVSFSESKGLKGGIEVGLVLPQFEMDAFNNLFNKV